MSRSNSSADAEVFVAAHLRRNFAVLALDYGLFGLGMTFSSTSTLLPALAGRLGASNVVIAAIPVLLLLGWSAPALFTARWIESLPRKMPFVLTYTVFERLPWLALAVAVFALAGSHPGVVIVLLVGVLALVSLAGGAIMPAWMDVVGRTIPTTYRGRFFATGGALSTGLGLAGAVGSGYLLQAYPFPVGYSLCLLATFLCLVVSYGALASAREPAFEPAHRPPGLRVHLARLPRMLRSNPTFTWYLVAQALRVLGMLGNGFFTVHALRSLGAEEWNVASFTFALLAAQSVGGLALGALADRRGHRASLLAGAVAACGSSVLALAITDPILYHGVFLLLGTSLAAAAISSMTLVLELGAREEWPTYLGLAATARAPFALLAPFLAAPLADAAGYGPVFVLAAVLNAASAAVYVFRVVEPRAKAE